MGKYVFSLEQILKSVSGEEVDQWCPLIQQRAGDTVFFLLLYNIYNYIYNI
jgi:hypothetical protein